MDDDGYDVVVVGGGPAGLSAALALSRSRRSVLVVDGGEPRNAPAAGMHNYLGRDGTPPGALLSAGRAEVAGYGGELLVGEVVAARPDAAGFAVELAGGTTVRARRLLITTGLVDELPAVPAYASSGGATSCTARTATAGRCATSPWACWPPARCPCTRR